MSGKSASSAAAPRLLLYVAERPALPAARHLRPPPAPPEPTFLYRPLNPDNKPYQTSNHYVPQPFVRDQYKDDKKDRSVRDSGPDFTVEHNSQGPEAERSRCLVPVSSDMPGQSVVIHQPQIHEGLAIQGLENCNRDILMDKNYLNYQFLEQNVCHQPVVNQNIGFLNQQVSVNRNLVVERDVSSAQLVRTADGVVLAVVPQTVAQDSEPSSRTSQSELPQTVTVPLGWRRIVNGTTVVYISPSGTPLSTLQHLREYLQTAGTCKCGLPCPLRPETFFSFDPNVVGKPYQPASGAELTKLCNHKRKLLATLQAKVQQSTTPPPPVDQKKVAGNELGPLKKMMKKQARYPTNVSQMMVQRDRPHADYKLQEEYNRALSPMVGSQRPNNGQPIMYNSMPTNMPNIPSQETEQKDNVVQKGSHYLTVNSGWIMHHRDSPELDPKQNTSHNNVGLPVLGTNGQIIGVNMSYNKHDYKANLDLEKEEKKSSKSKSFKDEAHIFSGLNQQLTPEVMQKINEQQQLFIQQNQKQIDAMKGYRSQLEQNSKQGSQYIPQGQLVIQNGAVVKTNPAKTPPWQVKKPESSNPMASPTPKQAMDGMDFDEQTSISEESTSSNNSFTSNESSMNPSMCSRVPPLPQHYNMVSQQYHHNIDPNKKKIKGNCKSNKKKYSLENKSMVVGNNGMKTQDFKVKDEIPNNNIPSFMDDPSGYLAQQTVLLNNTISRQVGINPSYDGNQYASMSYNHVEKSSTKPVMKSFDIPNMYRHNVVSNPMSSPNNMPDSSVVAEKVMDTIKSCCKGCNINKGPEFSDQIRLKYMKQNTYKSDMEGKGTSNHSFEDNPVSSSTFVDRSPMLDNCGPIQAGTVSTSNETLQPPEPSPTPSNSSRSTDTPHSNGNNSNNQQNCTYPISSPAYSNPGSSRDYSSNPSTPGSNQSYSYNSPGPSNNQNITGTQIMHFISNHNVNKNLMEVDNISTMVGSNLDEFKSEGRNDNPMPGYCPPPHLGGGPSHSLVQACYVQTFVTTMGSFSVTRDTVTSVLAGKSNTATTSINASQANFVRPPPPPSVNLASSYAIPNIQPDPFIKSVNLPTSYPLHIAGTTAQNMISKSPVEMMNNVIGGIPSNKELNQAQNSVFNRKPVTPGQILISSTGQIMVSTGPMPPPPPKTTTSLSQMQGSSTNTNVTTTVTQVVPAVGGVQNLVNQQTVVVNTLPAPFVIQPPVMAVDGQVVQQNVLPQIVTGGIVSGQSSESTRHIDVKPGQNFMQGIAMLSPESMKKKSRKKKSQHVTNVLQITSPQHTPNNIMVQHSSPPINTSPQFSPRGFQLSPNHNISPTPVLQALTIVPGKSGTPAHIVMNGQGNTNNFGSQQIITNSSPSQQINLLQPVNLINNASNVVQNFQGFQQFLLPNLGGMVMTADGTTIIQDNSSGMPIQLQLQTVNGQNVLTPVQNSGMFSGTNNVVLRTQNQQGKIIQSQHSPGAQFLSPNSQVMMNSPNFNGQLSPLLANLSPTNVTFNTSPPQVRTSNISQEFIQTNQVGQTLMVPLSPKPMSITQATGSRGNSTFVQQNTTIVQQQTTLVANSSTQLRTNIQGESSRVSIDPNLLLHKQKRFELPENSQEEIKEEKPVIPDEKIENADYAKFMNDFNPLISEGFVRHSVSTQTLVNQQRGKSPNSQAVSGSSPPDTTTHSPLGALEPVPSPRFYAARCVSTQGNYADTTTKSPEPVDASSSAMVQCVSSSEQDIADAREHAWAAPRSDFHQDGDAQNAHINIPMVRQNRTNSSMEPPEMHYSQNMPQINHTQSAIPPPNYYDRMPVYKRKNEFGNSTYRNDKMMRTNYNMVHGHSKDSDYDSDKRHYSASGSGSDNTSMQKVFDRQLGPSNDVKNEESADESQDIISERSRKFEEGDLVWGPVKGYASWPGKLEERTEDGKWRVKWYGGDKGLGFVEDARLLTLSEGLEAHHAARTKYRKSRKLNTSLENAIQAAMADLDKKSERTIQDDETAEHPDDVPISDTPKRTKKARKEKLSKKNPTKALKPSGDGSKLRNLR